MATTTLVEAALLTQDNLVRGIAEDIISINPIYTQIPWTGYTGQGFIVNRESTLGDAGFYSVGATITHKSPQALSQATFTSTKIIGDAEVDGLVQVQAEGDGVNQMSLEVSSKAKNIGRLFQGGMATGTGTSPSMNSLHSMCDSGQYTTASATQVLSWALLDELLDLVKSKDGQVDWIMMAPRTLRAYKVLYRATGGITPTMILNMPDGTTRSVNAYEDIPIFKNEYLPITETANGAAITGGALTSVWAGVWDDGTNKVGCAAIHPIKSTAGIQVQQVGVQEAVDSEIYRVKMYANFASFNRRGLARLTSISN